MAKMVSSPSMGVSMRCTVTFSDGPSRVIEAEVHAVSLFQAVVLALDVSRDDRKHPPGPDTQFVITALDAEERIVRYAGGLPILWAAA